MGSQILIAVIAETASEQICLYITNLNPQKSIFVNILSSFLNLSNIKN